VLDAGAVGVTVHPRPDQRHIRPTDVQDLAALLLDDSYRGREFNIEGNPLDEGGGHLMPMLLKVVPTQATLVPDSPQQATSDHGFRLEQPEVRQTLEPMVKALQEAGSRVSVFVDPHVPDVKGAAAVGADRIELYTEAYAKAFGTVHEASVLQLFIDAAHAAVDAGLKINAGHDLNLQNLGPLVQAIPAIDEVSIGQALVADALEIGMHAAVEAYLDVLNQAGSA
jgi:pyridoxine 5-phosphate synthase